MSGSAKERKLQVRRDGVAQHYHTNPPTAEDSSQKGEGARIGVNNLLVVGNENVSQLPKGHLDVRGTNWFRDKALARKQDRRNRDFRKQKFSHMDFDQVDLQGSDMSESSFFGVDMWRVDASNTTCRGVAFNDVIFKNVNMRGADLTGATFRDCEIPHGFLDLTDSNVTGQQMEQLELERFCPATGTDDERVRHLPQLGVIKYRQYSVDDIVEEFDIDHETLGVFLWSHDAEVRDNDTYEKVPYREFDPRIHHIPQWEVQAMSLNRRDLS